MGGEGLIGIKGGEVFVIVSTKKEDGENNDGMCVEERAGDVDVALLDELDKDGGKEALPGGVTLHDARHPVLIGCPFVQHEDHLAGFEGQLIGLIGVAVVQCNGSPVPGQGRLVTVWFLSPLKSILKSLKNSKNADNNKPFSAAALGGVHCC